MDNTYTRAVCAYSGCNKLRESKGIQQGKQSFKKWCHDHRRPKKNSHYYKMIDITVCKMCNKVTNCHRHRTGQFGRLYVEGNIIALCPECHQKVHKTMNPIPISS
jgi:hypothetical protein